MTDFPSISSLMKKSDKDEAKKAEDADAAPAERQKETPEEKFSEKMHELDIRQKEKETGEKAAGLGLSYIDLSGFPIRQEALKVVNQKTAEEKKLVCFYFIPDEMRLACVDYTDEIKELAYQIGERYSVQPQIYLISENSYQKALNLYKTLPIIKPISKDINITDEELNKFKEGITDIKSLSAHFQKVSISDILTLLIAAALKVGTSDVHVEAEEKGIMVRYRVDGILQEVAELPKDLWKKFISRIKLLAGLKINISDKPQDGRVTLKLSSGSLDVRVSTMPTVYGESVVMRILHSDDKGVSFESLGIRGAAFERLKREIERPNGMIITTGPTGSGKTTTLYSVLKKLNRPGVKIITLEDPVEIKMEGINQSQIDSSKGYTFSKGLRSILRQDPDICMVGEIRDLETAEIAIQAALTGHLMLSTIHTNSASGVIPRFLSMGVKPFLLAPSLNAVIGQRLVRKLCSNCAEEIELDPETMQRAVALLEKMPDSEKAKLDFSNLKFYQGKGCETCNGLGYKGRVGIYEIFTMNKEIEEIVLTGQVSEYKIEEIAVKGGMVTMVQDGLLKALDKITTVEEVFRVIE